MLIITGRHSLSYCSGGVFYFYLFREASIAFSLFKGLDSSWLRTRDPPVPVFSFQHLPTGVHHHGLPAFVLFVCFTVLTENKENKLEGPSANLATGKTAAGLAASLRASAPPSGYS